MASADGAHIVTGIAYLLAILLVLHVVIHIDGGVLHLSEGLHLVDGREPRHEAVHHELVSPLVFIHNIHLPVQEISRHLAVPTLPPHLIRRVGHTLAVVEVLPGVDVHAPVVQSPAAIQLLQVALELTLDILTEALEVVRVVDAARLHLVIHLIADDSGVLGKVLHHFADDALTVFPIGGVVDVHVLADAVVALPAFNGLRQNLWVFAGQPRGDAVGRCAEDHLDARLLHLVEDAVHPGELKLSVLRFEERPCGFSHAHHRQSCLLHQPNVLVQSVCWRVL